MLTDAEIHANVTAVRERIGVACRAAGRAPGEVTMLLAAKTMPADRIVAAIRSGIRLVGENKVQELAEKDGVLSSVNCERHFIGHLQSNKVNQVLRYVTCIQSVDSVGLADRLQKRLETLGGVLDVLIQVNTSGEVSKHGIVPDMTAHLAGQVAERDRLRVKGLMTVGMPGDDEGPVRASYRTLREVRDRARDITGLELPVLSMGMSGDLDIAIEEGATMVRIGTAVFGTRPSPLT